MVEVAPVGSLWASHTKEPRPQCLGDSEATSDPTPFIRSGERKVVLQNLPGLVGPTLPPIFKMSQHNQGVEASYTQAKHIKSNDSQIKPGQKTMTNQIKFKQIQECWMSSKSISQSASSVELGQ